MITNQENVNIIERIKPNINEYNNKATQVQCNS